MATFNCQIRKERPRADKTWNVVIRFTHNGKTSYIGTMMYVGRHDLTAKGRIKNQRVLDRCDELIRHYRERLYELNLELNEMSMNSIVRYMTAKKADGDLDFMEWYEQWRELWPRKGERNYRTAVMAYRRFLKKKDGESLMMSEVTVKNMMGFERWLDDRPRARTMYTNCIAKIFNDAREYYNDEDENIIRIKHSLRKYHAPKQGVAQKRALTVEQIRSIMDLPRKETRTSRYTLALDCFVLSFFLMGMNSVDLFNAERMEDGYIIYNRTKTKDRRSDGAEMRVRVHPYIAPLVRKYLDRTGQRLFRFHLRFANHSNFNQNVNKGLKEVGRLIGVPGLQFYAARHSMATIAMNDVRIPKYLVNDMLCHIDEAMRITDLYIRKDFAPINDANEQLLAYVLNY